MNERCTRGAGLACALAALGACGASTPTPAPAAANRARAASTAPAPRDPLPPGYRLIHGDGYSLGLPESWDEVPRASGTEVVYAAPGPPQTRLGVMAFSTPFEGTLDDFVAMALAGYPRLELSEVSRARSVVGGAPALDIESRIVHTMTVRTLGFIVASTHLNAFLNCGLDTPSDGVPPSECRRAYESFRLGNGPIPLPAGMQRVGGDDWSVEIPTTWHERRTSNGAREWTGPAGDAGRLAYLVFAQTHNADPPAYIDSIVAYLARRPGYTVYARQDVPRGVENRTTLEYSYQAPETLFSQIQRLFIHGDVAVWLACHARRGFTDQDRATCTRLLDTVRGE